jgi:hypothetical protein
VSESEFAVGVFLVGAWSGALLSSHFSDDLRLAMTLSMVVLAFVAVLGIRKRRS